VIQKIIKYSCLFALLFLLLIPALKEHTPLLNREFNMEPLKGWFPPVDSAKFSQKNWFNGSYQKQQEEFLKRNLKIRPYAVRMSNQIHYNALGEIRRDIVEGEDNYLFETGYIHALQGKDFIGTQKIKEQADKLKVVADFLKKENDVEVIVTIAFDKARFYKDKLPKQYDLENADSTNYDTYLHFLQKNKIHVLDFNQYFLDKKNETEHNFGTKHGIHWSLYGGLLATDSIIGYVEKLKGKEITRIDKSEITKTTQPRKEDDDIGQSINLYYPLQPDSFSYFEHHLFQEKKEYKPNVAIIGDSFCWTIWGQDIPHHYFGEETFFSFYYRDIYDVKWTPDISIPKFREEKKLLSTFQKQDVIVLLYTPMNMSTLGSGFIDEMYEMVMMNDE